LVAERDDFQVQRGARLDEKSKRVEQRHGDRRHDCRLSENARNLNRRNTYEVLGSHTPRRQTPNPDREGDSGIGGVLSYYYCAP
jgi:hypothetical protein